MGASSISLAKRLYSKFVWCSDAHYLNLMMFSVCLYIYLSVYIFFLHGFGCLFVVVHFACFCACSTVVKLYFWCTCRLYTLVYFMFVSYSIYGMIVHDF